MTSRQAVTFISQFLKIKKVGHAGTLDPIATGVLPIAIGEATKFVSFIQNENKKYSFTIKWGIQTDTNDLEGVVIGKCKERPTQEQILR